MECRSFLNMDSGIFVLFCATEIFSEKLFACGCKLTRDMMQYTGVCLIFLEVSPVQGKSSSLL